VPRPSVVAVVPTGAQPGLTIDRWGSQQPEQEGPKKEQLTELRGAACRRERATIKRQYSDNAHSSRHAHTHKVLETVLPPCDSAVSGAGWCAGSASFSGTGRVGWGGVCLMAITYIGRWLHERQSREM